MKKAVGPEGIIFTSGGIGPTHDDVTYDAIAEAFDRKLVVHPETLKRMTAHYSKKGQEVNESRLRMATLPEGCEVLFSDETWVPLVVLEGVHILPGIPRLFQMMLSAQTHRFQGRRFHAVSLFTSVGEGILAKPLAQIALQVIHFHAPHSPTSTASTTPHSYSREYFVSARGGEGRGTSRDVEREGVWCSLTCSLVAGVARGLRGAQHPSVRIGSYPKGQEGDYTVKLTVEGRETVLVDAAVQAICATIAVDRTEMC